MLPAWTFDEVMTAVTGFLDIPVIKGMVILTMALGIAPMLIGALRRVTGVR